jgi:hypothetical protein
MKKNTWLSAFGMLYGATRSGNQRPLNINSMKDLKLPTL